MNKVTKRPWGSFTVLQKTPCYWVKKLVIKPQQQLSLQYHKYRDEDWYVIEGVGELTLQNRKYQIEKNDKWHISSFVLHRIKNTQKKGNLIIVEIATGKPEENDIIRLEDDYNRIKKD